MHANPQIQHFVRDETCFAGIRKPIKTRDELLPRLEIIKAACQDAVAGPLTHILRFDTPVEGFDSEIGYPVKKEINQDEIKTV